MSAVAFETDRLLVVAAENRDASALSKLMTVGISHWLANWPFPISVAEIEGLIADLSGRRDAHGFVVKRRMAGDVCGWLKCATSEENNVELSFWLGEAYQGQGLANELGQGALALAFGCLGAERVVAGAQLDNNASIGMLKKLGMQPTHQCEVWASSRQRMELCQFFAMDRSEFVARMEGT